MPYVIRSLSRLFHPVSSTCCTAAGCFELISLIASGSDACWHELPCSRQPGLITDLFYQAVISFGPNSVLKFARDAAIAKYPFSNTNSNHSEIKMRTKILASLVFCVILAGSAWGIHKSSDVAGTVSHASEGCCATGNCCCPGQGSCCANSNAKTTLQTKKACCVKAKSATAQTAAVAKSNSSCVTGNCCCPGKGSCCASAKTAG